MSNIWLYSDPHFWHTRGITLMNRPFSSVEEMNEHYINNINELAGPNDKVYCLGDFSFGNLDQTEEVLKRIKPKQILILGNHCKGIRKNKQRFAKYFDGIYDLYDFRVGQQVFILSHYPMRSWEKSNYNSILCHGHCHGSLEPYGKSVDVGVDAPFIRNTPAHGLINIEEVIDFMKDRPSIKDYGD